METLFNVKDIMEKNSERGLEEMARSFTNGFSFIWMNGNGQHREGFWSAVLSGPSYFSDFGQHREAFSSVVLFAHLGMDCEMADLGESDQNA